MPEIISEFNFIKFKVKEIKHEHPSGVYLLPANFGDGLGDLEEAEGDISVAVVRSVAALQKEPVPGGLAVLTNEGSLRREKFVSWYALIASLDGVVTKLLDPRHALAVSLAGVRVAERPVITTTHQADAQGEEAQEQSYNQPQSSHFSF